MENVPGLTMMDSHDQLETLLSRAGVGMGASDLHGSVTGFVCGGGTARPGEWLKALELEPGEDAHRQQLESRIADMVSACRTALDDAQLGFEPLLPDAGRPLPERADALVDWCRGFLGGFGLAGGPGSQVLTTDGHEVLRDFGTIAASELSVGESDEDEHSLMEVSEFVRIGALLLHAEMAGRGVARPPGASVH